MRLKNALFYAFLYISALIGAGFATGKELYYYFFRYGASNGIFGVFISALLFAAAAYLLVRVASLASAAFNYGLMGLAQPVWGIKELLYCPYRFSVWQYVLVSCGCELLAVLVMTLLFTAVSALCRTGILSYIVNALLLGGSVTLYYVSPHSEWLKGPLALLSPLNYFESYYIWLLSYVTH